MRWILTIGSDGELHSGFADTMQPPADGKGRSSPKRFEVPKRSSRTTQNLTEFVIDKPEYVFGWVNEVQKVPPEKLEKVRPTGEDAPRPCIGTRSVSLRDRADDDGLRALVRFLDHPLPTLPADPGEGDLIGFGNIPTTRKCG